MSKIKEIRSKIQYGEFYKSMQTEWNIILKEYRKAGKKIVVWGAGLKGNAFLEVTDPGREFIAAVVDMNQKLHGTKTSTGHDIVSSEYVVAQQADVVLVMNELFYVDIYFMLGKIGYKGFLIDVDYVIKHHCTVETVVRNCYQNIDLKDDKLFGYTMQDLHECVLRLLKEIDKICSRHKIQYFLEAGSALGAERYGGFIPCDDDIDIALLRDDYEKFVQIAKKELPPGMLIQTIKKGMQYPYPYAQVVMDHTSFVRENFRNLNMHLGLHIDVAPIDYVSDDLELQKKQFADAKKITQLIRKKMIPEDFTGTKWYQKYIVNMDYYLLKLVPLSLLVKKQNRVYTRFNCKKTNYLGDLCTHYKKILAFEKDKILPTERKKFEDGYYPVPKDLDYYLAIIYDDYKKISPRENGSVKYDVIDVSLERNYDGRNRK